MSWKATVYVAELITCPNGEKLTKDEKLLLFLLADHHNTSDEETRPSLFELSKEALMSERHARRLIRALEEKGVLTCTPGQGKGHTSSYVFCELQKRGRAGPLYQKVNADRKRTESGQGESPNKEDLVSINQEPILPSLHAQVAKLIQGRFQAHNQIKCPWDGSEASLLKKLIDSNPSWTLTDFSRMVNNRFDSEGINGERPRMWLGNLSKYTNAALDIYGHPKGLKRDGKQGFLDKLEALRRADGSYV